VECIPFEATKVEVMSTTGDMDFKSSQLEHLRTMSMNHFKWYEYYQNAYQALLEKKPSH